MEELGQLVKLVDIMHYTEYNYAKSRIYNVVICPDISSMPTRPDYINRLEELGLSKHEASVYFAALNLGSAKIQQLAMEAGVKRTTVYSVIESLKRRGLMVEHVRGFKRYFAPESPRRLEKLLADQRARLEDMLPVLEALSNPRARDSFIRHYEGIEEVRAVYTLMISDVRPGDDYLVLGNYDQWFDLAPKFFPDFIRRRARIGAKIKMLLVDTPVARERRKSAADYGEEVRFLPANLKLAANLVVTPKRALLHQLVSPFMALLIENTSVVQTHQQMYWLLWNQSPES